jgi:hypothetical protein
MIVCETSDNRRTPNPTAQHESDWSLREKTLVLRNSIRRFRRRKAIVLCSLVGLCTMLATVPTVGEVVAPEREIIAVHTNDTVSQVLRTLGENGIFSGESPVSSARQAARAVGRGLAKEKKKKG